MCAIRSGQLGLDTTIVEAHQPGGTCLNVGCIPSKALIHAANEFQQIVSASTANGSAAKIGISSSSPAIDLSQTVAWKDGIVAKLNAGVTGLLSRANVRVLEGKARFRDGKTVLVTDKNGDTQQVHCEHVVIATGSVAVDLPDLPFGEHVLSSTEALSLNAIPKSLAVIGGGYIGLELGMSYAKFGSKVTVIESDERVLSQFDKQLTEPVNRKLAELGVDVQCSTTALHYDSSTRELHVRNAVNAEHTVSAEKVLLTIGRKAQLKEWGLTELSLTTENGALVVDDRCRTSMQGVYAIGDVTGEPMLAHRAMAQGEYVAKQLAGLSEVWDKQCIPAVCFTDPEIVTAGLTVEEASQSGVDVSVSVMPFRSNGRALSMHAEDGFIRLVVDEANHAVVGVQAVGAGVSELASTFALAIEMGARTDDIAATVHAHPTLGEAFQEAAMLSLGQGLHG